MLTKDSSGAVYCCSEVMTRRRLLRIATTVAATAPLAALTAGGTTQGSPGAPAAAPRRITSAVLVPRFGGDVTADWYSSAISRLTNLGIMTKVVSLLPGATAPGVAETVGAIDKAVGDDPYEIAQTILIGHSVGSRALLAYLSRQGAHQSFAGLVSVAGWFTVDNVISYPALGPWVNMDLDFASIVSAAGPITVHLSDNDPFTADWRANAADWLAKLGAAVHIAHGAGHYMTTSMGSVLDTILVASLRSVAR